MNVTSSRLRRALPALLALLATTPAVADLIPPVLVQIREREPGSFLVQWYVPKVLPAQALPSPVLPAGSRPDGERALLEQRGGWLVRQVYACPQGLSGRTVGIRYPLYNPSLSTVFRVELLSGERFVRSLGPREESWRLPESDVATFARWLVRTRAAALAGLEHALDHWVHVAFLLALTLVGGAAGSIGLVTAFTTGQLVAAGITALVGRPSELVLAEVCVALAAALLAREALRPERPRLRLVGLAGAAGLFHGSALATLLPAAADSGGAALSELVSLVLGMDAVLLVPALLAAGAFRVAARRQNPALLRSIVAYVAGGSAVAAMLALTFAPPARDPSLTPPARVPGLPRASSAGLPGSRLVARQAASAPIQSFVAIEPFEVRHEVMLRLRDVAAEIGVEIPGDGVLEIEAQGEVTRKLSELVLERCAVTIDGQPAEGSVDRAGFMTADSTGVLPRKAPVREPVQTALVGVTVAYMTEGVPQELTLSWSGLDDDDTPVPATINDPESSQTTTLTAGQPVIRWRNELLSNPAPVVRGAVVEPVEVPVPLASCALVLLAVVLGWTGLRRGRGADRRAGFVAAARIALAGALVVTQFAQVAVALPHPFGGAISPREARRVVARLLTNVYRAVEFRQEAAVYDRLAVSVTGETLADVYLRQRRALEVEERGGARARMDAVEVLDVRSLKPVDDGFEIEASWTVSGTVTHFGHRHFRQNRYDARLTVVHTDGLWKIRALDVLEQERVK